jgi:hypothetical protein
VRAIASAQCYRSPPSLAPLRVPRLAMHRQPASTGRGILRQTPPPPRLREKGKRSRRPCLGAMGCRPLWPCRKTMPAESRRASTTSWPSGCGWREYGAVLGREEGGCWASGGGVEAWLAFLQRQRGGDRRCAVSSRSVQRPKGARSTTWLGVIASTLASVQLAFPPHLLRL